MAFSEANGTVFLWFALHYLVMVIGGLAMLSYDWRDWYAALRKSRLTPPNWLFGPMWFTIYTLQSVACYIAFVTIRDGAISVYWSAFAVTLVGIVLNAAWTPVFFGMRMIRLAALVLALYWAFSVAQCVLFFLMDARAGGLTVLNCVWATLALWTGVYVWVANDVCERESVGIPLKDLVPASA